MLGLFAASTARAQTPSIATSAASAASGDPLPPRAQLRLGAARFTHRDTIQALAFSPDGRRLASAGLDGAIVLWEIPGGREAGRLVSQERLVNSVAFSPDGQWLLAPFQRGARVWDANRLTARYSIAADGPPLTHALYAPDGKRLLTLTYPFDLVLRDAATGREVRRIHEECPLSAVAFAKDGALLASGCSDGTIRVRDSLSGKLKALFKGHTKEVRALAFAPNGALVSGSADDTLRFWNLANGDEERRISGVHGHGVSALAFSPDGTKLASGGGLDSDVRLFDAAMGNALFEVEVADHVTTSLAFSPDGKWLAAAGFDRRIKLIDVAARATVRLSEGHEDGVSVVVMSTNGQRLISGGRDQRIISWDLTTGAKLGERLQPGRPSGLAMRDSGELIVVLGGLSKTLFLDERSLLTRREIDGGESGVTAVRDLVAIGDSVRVLLFRGTTPLDPIRTGLLETFGVALSPNQKLLSVGGATNLQRGGSELWELEPRRLIIKLPGHQDPLSATQFSPDGSTLFNASAHQIRIWNTQRTLLVRAFDVLDQQVVDLALSPDGQTLAAGLENGTIRLWRWQRGLALPTLSGHFGAVSQVIFSPDGKRIASASDDGSVLVFAAP